MGFLVNTHVFMFHAFYDHSDTRTQRKIQARLYKPLNLRGGLKSSGSFRVVFFQLICSSAFHPNVEEDRHVYNTDINGSKALRSPGKKERSQLLFCFTSWSGTWREDCFKNHS